MKRRSWFVLFAAAALGLTACHHRGGRDGDHDGGPHRGGGHWDGGAGHRGHAPAAGSAAPAR